MSGDLIGRACVQHARVPARFACAVLLLAVILPVRAQPPVHGEVRPSRLVELVRLDSTLHLDIRYATSNNFMRRPMYAEARAFLQLPAAEALVRVHRSLRIRGFGLLIFDGYRPWSVTKEFWEGTPPSLRKFVANPRKGSKHNRGCAVDLSLYDISTGREVRMPSPYDDFTERASAAYGGGDARPRARRDLLRAAMEAEGFSVNPDEWWHFDYREWKFYGNENIPFSMIR
jgi:D-alanyl-D-alanine dipeptidase